MTSRSFLSMVAAAVLAVACSPKVSDQTTINGTFEGEASKSVSIVIPLAGIDTTIAVSGNKFSVELPKQLKCQAQILAGDAEALFISDGTTLSATFKETGEVEIVSSNPEASVYEKFKVYDRASKELERVVSEKLEALEAKSGSEFEAIIDQYDKDVVELALSTIEQNKDNCLGVQALMDVKHELDLATLQEVVDGLDPSLDDLSQVINIKDVLARKTATAEGRMFTDFEIGGAKLSDHVGKGKYVLVDFWASWCGPCKREIPNIKSVYEKYAGEDFDVLSVSVWDRPQATVDTAKAYGVCWNEIVGDDEREATAIYGIQGIPHIILFGPDGTIVKRELRGAGIEEEVAKHVKAKK